MASLAAVTPAVRARTRVAAHAGTIAAVSVSLIFSSVFIARTAFTVGRTTYFSLFDDAMISMQYARNLAHGDGLVWNAHQPAVEGYTNFLWTIWMALVHLTPIPESKIALAIMVTSALLLAANVAVIGAVARELGAGLVVRVTAMFATAFYYPLVYWSLRGMEVGLLSFIVSAATLLSLRLARERTRRNTALLCGLLVTGSLTRPDAALLMLCFVAYLTWRARPGLRLRVGAPLLASVVAPAIALTVFRELYYHALLPNTYYLKMSGVPLWDRLHRGLVAFYELEVAHLWGPTIAVIALFVGRRRIGHELGLLLTLVLTACLYSIYVGGDAWEWMLYSNRYIAPVVPLMLVLAVFGLREIVANPPRRKALLTTIGGAAAIVSLMSLGTHGALAGTKGLAWALIPPFALLVAVVAPLSWRVLRGNGESAAPITALLTVLLLIVSVNFDPAADWASKNANHVRDDAMTTRRGLELRAETSPSRTIAVIWAGAIPYFAHRPAIDLLGKSDPVIARLQDRKPFFPGHSKWDYAYSVKKLEPDVIAQGLWPPTPRTRQMLERWGYRKVATRLHKWPIYVKQGVPYPSS
jgi:hypothetical protein